MALFDRTLGSEFSEVEKALIFEKKYASTGYVEYSTKSGDCFYLHPSPFLKTTRNEIYHTSQYPPPPNHTFIQTHVIDETEFSVGMCENNWLTCKEIDTWCEFDPSSIASRRKTLDYAEIIHYFTKFYKGEAENVNEIAGCSTLFTFSSPSNEARCGGINSAVLGRPYQWALFNKSLGLLPLEFRNSISDYYYYISKFEKPILKITGERNIAIHNPKNLLSDIPLVILDESPKKLSKEFQGQLAIEAKVIQANLLDALLIRPQTNTLIEKMMIDEILKMREECYSVGIMPYNQNLGAIPKLAASYCRLKSNIDIRQEDINYVVDLWFEMRKRAGKIEASTMKTSHMLELTSDARRVYLKLHDIFDVETEISMIEALRETKMEALDLELAVDSLENKGYCLRKDKSFFLLDP